MVLPKPPSLLSHAILLRSSLSTLCPAPPSGWLPYTAGGCLGAPAPPPWPQLPPLHSLLLCSLMSAAQTHDVGSFTSPFLSSRCPRIFRTRAASRPEALAATWSYLRESWKPPSPLSHATRSRTLASTTGWPPCSASAPLPGGPLPPPLPLRFLWRAAQTQDVGSFTSCHLSSKCVRTSTTAAVSKPRAAETTSSYLMAFSKPPSVFIQCMRFHNSSSCSETFPSPSGTLGKMAPASPTRPFLGNLSNSEHTKNVWSRM
mmetsp:Transcript_29676/g.59830  ORF Transcript_29676/g.59830 Transcript_29676/m.59830 type:complete len:259 (-) Transcript_29676:241-1017(-)